MPDLATNLTTAAATPKDMAANLADTAAKLTEMQGNLAATAETMKANLALGERARREDRLIHRLGQYERIVAA